MKKFTVDYFIEKFSSIPDNMWSIGNRLERNGKRCAHGHCYIGDPNQDEYNDEEIALCKLARLIGRNGFAFINNGDDEEYQQATPKLRVIAALNDVKRKQEPEVKERIVYVIVDEKVRDIQAAELIEN